MLNSQIIPPDTQAILLLCSSLEQKYNPAPKPLNISEYNSLARWLRENQLTPANLLEPTLNRKLSNTKINNLDSDRLLALLNRGMMLSLSVEKWTSKGLWVIGRGEPKYPQSLKRNLYSKAPPIIYGIGTIDLLYKGGLAIVGSRNIDDEAIEYTQRIVELCASQEMQIVSGGARGVDQASMLGCVNAGGTSLGILADSLTKASVASQYREAIKQGRLTLISPYHPEASFSVGNAMGRNKYIYALADYALVISSSLEKGGTWAGAVEALEKIKSIPVFVRNEGNIPEGNLKLLQLGAYPFPESPWYRYRCFQELLSEYIKNYKSTTNTTKINKNNQGKQTSLLPLLKMDTVKNQSSVQAAETGNSEIDTISQSKDIHYLPKSVYEAVLPLILNSLKIPKTDKDLATDLEVQVGQIKAWLKMAVSEGKVIKNKKPVTYEINPLYYT